LFIGITGGNGVDKVMKLMSILATVFSGGARQIIPPLGTGGHSVNAVMDILQRIGIRMAIVPYNENSEDRSWVFVGIGGSDWYVEVPQTHVALLPMPGPGEASLLGFDATKDVFVSGSNTHGLLSG
jgi:hypothetical protein